MGDEEGRSENVHRLAEWDCTGKRVRIRNQHLHSASLKNEGLKGSDNTERDEDAQRDLPNTYVAVFPLHGFSQ